MPATLAPAEKPVPPILVLAIVLVVLGLALLRTLMAAETDFVADEAYYAFWSLHLSPGYFDHPPAIAWLMALGRLVSESSLGARLAALAGPLIISLALYRTGAILLDRRAGLLAVLWYNLSVGAQLSLLATPDVPSTLFWMLATWAVAEFMRTRNANWWLAVGLFAGLGVLGKYTNLFFGVGVLALIVSARPRWTWLGLWQLWAGGAIALLVVAPNLVWNAQNGWVTFLFQGGRISHDPMVSDVGAGYLELLGAQALFLGPIIVLAFLAAIPAYALRASRWSGLTWPLLSILPGLLYFAIHGARARVEANWLLPFWPMASLIAAHLLLSGLSGTRLRRIFRGGLVGLQTLLSLVLTGILAWVALAHPAGLEHLDRTRDMRGWLDTARQLDRFADAAGARWVAVPGGYGTVGLFAANLHFIGDDRRVVPLDGLDRYTFLDLDPAALPFPAILVDEQTNSERFGALFGTVTELGTIERRWRNEVLGRYTVLSIAAPTPAFFEAMAKSD